MPMRNNRAYYGGNVSMHSGSNDGYSQYSGGGGAGGHQVYAAPQVVTAKLKDNNSVHGGGLSDASSARDNVDGRSLRSHNEVLNTPSSMMGS